MFDKSKEGKFTSKRAEFMKALREDVASFKVSDGENTSCLKVNNVNNVLKATFQFLKDNQQLEGGAVALTFIVLKIFLTNNFSSTQNNFQTATTYLTGQVKEVYESFVVLTSKNSLNQEFEVTISYEDIVYFGSSAILDNFENYVNLINSFPPLCKDTCSESYDLLVRIAKILGKNDPRERDFVLVLDRALSRRIGANELGILRNLVLVDEFYIIPITSIQGFSQVPNQN